MIPSFADVSKEPIEKTITTYDYNTMTVCNGKNCTATIGGSYAYDVDGKWKPIDDAKSLKNSSVQCSVNSDGVNIAKCLDWNTTSITVNLSNKNILSVTDIPIKIYTPNITKDEYEKTGDYKKDYIVKSSVNLSFASKEVKTQVIPFSLGDILEFGSNSTTITLNESNGGNVGDTRTRQDSPTLNYGAINRIYVMSYLTNNYRLFILWNMSIIPAGSTITNANLSMYMYGIPSSSRNINAYNTSPMNTTGTTYWNEGTLQGADCGTKCNLDQNLTHNNQPSAGTLQDTEASGTTAKWLYWNVTNGTITAHANTTYPRLSILLKDNAEDDADGYSEIFCSKESNNNDPTGCSGVSTRPQLVITYTEGAVATTNYTNITESISYSETTSKWSNIYKTTTDSTGYSESDSFFRRAEQSLTSSATYNDILNRIASFFRRVYDSIFFNETQFLVPNIYSLVITNPTTANPMSVTSSQNITITFNFTNTTGQPILNTSTCPGVSCNVNVTNITVYNSTWSGVCQVIAS